MVNKDTYVVLDKFNFTKEVLANDGYFVDQIPPCFTTGSLSKSFENFEFYDKLISTFSIRDVKDYPIEISVYKENILRRTLSFPNILAYLRLLKTMEDNFDYFSNFLCSPNSESKANIITTLNYPSNFKKSIMERNIKFAGNKFKLSIDIANCYPSIYSHSITWALVGKDDAKAMLQGLKEKTSLYKRADKIETENRRMKGAETNGLLTGPLSSRILSEIVLAAIDKILVENGYEFSRYVDDYNFYFTSKYDAEKSISEIAKILSEYNLKVNESKIKIEKYPFDVLEDYSSYFQQSINKKYPTYDILQKAQLLDQQGKKGSYKYAFKMLRNMPSIRIKNSEEIFYLFYTLISMIINRPMMSRYAVEMISKLQVVFSENEMIGKLNDLLSKEIESGHDQEVLWLLYVILRYGSKITIENVVRIIEKSNDFAIMMILELLNNNRDKIKDYKDKSSYIRRCLKQPLKQLEESLSTESLLSKRWFLLYEINYYKLKPLGFFKNLDISSNPTYKILKDNSINFYKKIIKKRQRRTT